MWLLSSLPGYGASAVDEPAPSQYTDVVNALQTTSPVRLLTDLDQCENESEGKPGPSLHGGLSINTFVVLPGRGLFFFGRTSDPGRRQSGRHRIHSLQFDD
jgi:hypothetical protein